MTTEHASVPRSLLFSPTSYHSSLSRYVHPIFLKEFDSFSILCTMALLDLDKIIIKRTVVGIRCTSCGGNLQMSKKKSVTSRFIQLIFFGAVQPKNYECENCKKRHLLI